MYITLQNDIKISERKINKPFERPSANQRNHNPSTSFPLRKIILPRDEHNLVNHCIWALFFGHFPHQSLVSLLHSHLTHFLFRWRAQVNQARLKSGTNRIPPQTTIPREGTDANLAHTDTHTNRHTNTDTHTARDTQTYSLIRPSIGYERWWALPLNSH